MGQIALQVADALWPFEVIYETVFYNEIKTGTRPELPEIFAHLCMGPLEPEVSSGGLVISLQTVGVFFQ
jgi:hypothetical protein